MCFLDELEEEFCASSSESRLEYLGVRVFGFVTGDAKESELFARKAVEVCAAINAEKTSTYIATPDNYLWFLIMCNMPFFAKRIEWGASIRCAWWKPRISYGGESFKNAKWEEFISAVVAFAEPEMKGGHPVVEVTSMVGRKRETKVQRYLREHDIEWGPVDFNEAYHAGHVASLLYVMVSESIKGETDDNAG